MFRFGLFNFLHYKICLVQQIRPANNNSRMKDTRVWREKRTGIRETEGHFTCLKTKGFSPKVYEIFWSEMPLAKKPT